MNDNHTMNEFRQDLVSGEWILFSTNRTHSIRKFEDPHQPKEGCPFENLEKSGHEVICYYPDNADWHIAVIKNKFPAVESGICTPGRKVGLFNIHDAIGEHEIFVYPDHDKQLSDFNIEEMSMVIKAFKLRKEELKRASTCVKYVAVFYNFGSQAGASIAHPHSQILSLPILPPDVSRSLHGAHRFFKENGRKVYDILIEWEREQKTRMIYENEHFIAFCPFASRSPYEVRIFPKDSASHFVHISEDQIKYLAEALSTVLRKMKVALDNPAMNFFIHTAPVETELKDIQDFYTWHIEILPKVKIDAGFEIGTGIDINVVDPDYAAKLLRDAKID